MPDCNQQSLMHALHGLHPAGAPQLMCAVLQSPGLAALVDDFGTRLAAGSSELAAQLRRPLTPCEGSPALPLSPHLSTSASHLCTLAKQLEHATCALGCCSSSQFLCLMLLVQLRSSSIHRGPCAAAQPSAAAWHQEHDALNKQPAHACCLAVSLVGPFTQAVALQVCRGCCTGPC